MSSIFRDSCMKIPTELHKLGAWYALVLVAMYNMMDYIGRYTPLKIESRIWLMIATFSPQVFVPAFYFKAKYGYRG